jgi:hypothetical protein
VRHGSAAGLGPVWVRCPTPAGRSACCNSKAARAEGLAAGIARQHLVIDMPDQLRMALRHVGMVEIELRPRRSCRCAASPCRAMIAGHRETDNPFKPQASKPKSRQARAASLAMPLPQNCGRQAPADFNGSVRDDRNSRFVMFRPAKPASPRSRRSRRRQAEAGPCDGQQDDPSSHPIPMRLRRIGKNSITLSSELIR